MTRSDRMISVKTKFMKNIAFFLLALYLVSPVGYLFAGELTFPPAILKMYDESLSAVERGNIEDFREKVTQLKNEIYRHGLLSINSFVDESLSRSYALERKKRLTIVRISLQVSPLNVKYWLYLGLNDLLEFNLYAFWDDIRNMYYGTLKNPIPLLKSIYIIFGFFVFFLLFLSFFFSIAILFKYYSSLIADILRIKALKKMKFLISPLLILLFIFSAYVMKSPFAVLMFWLVVLSPYMVNREIFLTFIIGVLIIASMFFNNKVSAYSQMAVSPARENLLHLAQGIAPSVRGIEVDLSEKSLMSSAGKVRYDYLMGNFNDSIRVAEDLENTIGGEYGILVSMGKFYQGDYIGAISKLTEVKNNYLEDPVILFNLYQIYMTSYNFEEAAKIQKNAWSILASDRPFQIDPSKIEEKILVPPSISGKFIRLIMEDMENELYKKLPFYNLWVSPWGSSLMFFCLLLVLFVALRLITHNRYVILACRICGYKQLWKVRFKKEDLCQYCRSKSHPVKGSAGSTEKSYQIRTHKRAVRIKSLLLPGFGFLSVGAVSMYFIINIVMSFFTALFLFFFFAFPGEYSPLYAIISRLGTVISGFLLITSYFFILVSNELLLRRLDKKYKIEEI